MDVIATLAFLAVLGPALIAIAAIVASTSPGGPFFTQVRAGVGGRPFTIYKFRTMTVEGERAAGERYSREQTEARITRIGALLRRFSVDELPQLLNILRGDMSLVGPRPDTMQHAEVYSEAQRQRLAVRPGVTGWAQVHGRNQLTWDERIELDVEYIQQWTLALDLRILVRTVQIVLAGKGSELPRGAR